MGRQKEKGIHPALVALMTGEELPANTVPTAAMLPGSAARMVGRRVQKVEPRYTAHRQRLKCMHCGRAAFYDIGLTVFDGTGWVKAVESSGYLSNPDASYKAGVIQLYDGTRPKWTSDGEERFLERLQHDPQDSLLWDKLGNLYDRGGRPELAAAGQRNGTAAAAAAAHEVHLYKFELQPGDRESFLPVAEMLMGDAAERIPAGERRLRKHPPTRPRKKGGRRWW